MIQTKCLRCRRNLLIDNIRRGVGYFFGYDSDYYGDSLEDSRDPHNVIGYYCEKCGQKIEKKAESIGWKRVID
jgi:hypothetical protein